MKIAAAILVGLISASLYAEARSRPTAPAQSSTTPAKPPSMARPSPISFAVCRSIHFPICPSTSLTHSTERGCLDPANLRTPITLRT